MFDFHTYIQAGWIYVHPYKDCNESIQAQQEIMKGINAAVKMSVYLKVCFQKLEIKE